MTARDRARPGSSSTTVYVTWCCGHLEVLESTLPVALRQSWQVVLVDYSDPHGAGAWAERLRHPRLRVVRATARYDASRRPIQSQAQAWQAAIDSLPEEGFASLVLADPLALVSPRTASEASRLPEGEARWQEDLILLLPLAAAREHRCCPAYVGAGAEVADLRARLAAGGLRLLAQDLGARRASSPPLPPLASVRLLAQRVACLGLGQGPAREALGRLAGPLVSARNH